MTEKRLHTPSRHPHPLPVVLVYDSLPSVLAYRIQSVVRMSPTAFHFLLDGKLSMTRCGFAGERGGGHGWCGLIYEGRC